MGKIYFKVDGKIMQKYFIIFGGLRKSYTLTVGNEEKHIVKVEMIRKLLFTP